MIDNFAPQSYPLECSWTGEEWSLVIGWQRLASGQLTPVVAAATDPLVVVSDPQALRYRLADTRPSVVPTMRTVRPQRESPA